LNFPFVQSTIDNRQSTIDIVVFNPELKYLNTLNIIEEQTIKKDVNDNLLNIQISEIQNILSSINSIELLELPETLLDQIDLLSSKINKNISYTKTMVCSFIIFQLRNDIFLFN